MKNNNLFADTHGPPRMIANGFVDLSTTETIRSEFQYVPGQVTLKTNS